jgi:outer membrane protein assembly factor BamB
MKRLLAMGAGVAAAATFAWAFMALNPSSAQGEGGVTVAPESWLSGTWVATLTHDGETQPLALRFEPKEGGVFRVDLTNPAIHVWEVPIAQAAIEGNQVRIGKSLVFDYDPAARTLSGEMPKSLVPVHPMPATFRKKTLERPPRAELRGPVASPVWVFDAGAPVWADVAHADGVVYAGGADGRLHALEAQTGRELWVFRAGGPIRARATRAGAALFVHADDGFLYKIVAATGAELFKVRVDGKPIERFPPDDERSRFDVFASAAAIDHGHVYIGTHDGHVLAVGEADGKRLWDFAAGDSVSSTPVVEAGRVYFGSFDGNVYAVSAASGALAWKRDTGAPVVSTPAVNGGHVIVGSRSYDLMALRAENGTPVWTRYIWFSWVESPPSVRDGMVYVGSSDAARLFAFDARTGLPSWDLDVHGWAWGQPAVTDARVFIGTSAAPHYLVAHDSAFLAVDRKTGQVAWRFPLAPPGGNSTYGFTASPAVAEGLVFAGALDGKVYAFAQ